MNFDFCLLRKSNGKPLRLLLLVAALFYFATEFGTVFAGSKQGTNIVLTKDTLVLNDHHKKHSNNIVIKDGKGHHHQHHCNCHEHHLLMPMHHWGHEHWDHEHWDHHHHHKRSDPGQWWSGDMQLAASNQMSNNQQPRSSPAFFEDGHMDGDLFDGQHSFKKHYENYEQSPFLQGSGNEALNSLIKQRYMNPIPNSVANPVAQPQQPTQQYNQFGSESLHKTSYPVFVKDDQN